MDTLEIEPELSEECPPLAGLVGPLGLDHGVLDAAPRVHKQRLELGLQVVYGWKGDMNNNNCIG